MAEHLRQPERIVQLLAGRWTLAVVAELVDAGCRYQDIHDALGGISYKVLTDTLRRAERDGLIARHLDGERIETATLYELTDLGRSLDAAPTKRPPGARSSSPDDPSTLHQLSRPSTRSCEWRSLGPHWLRRYLPTRRTSVLGTECYRWSCLRPRVVVGVVNSN